MQMHAILFLSDFFEILQPITRICQRVVRTFLVIPLFIFGVGFSGDRTSLLDAISSLRSNTEHEDELEAGCTSSPRACSASLLNEFCDSDAEDELLSGMVMYEIVCLADNTLPVFGQPWFLTADPLIGVSVVLAKLA